MPEAPLTELVNRLRNLAAEPGDGVADADLLRRFVQDRDAVAFEALVWRHARLVMGICRRTLRHLQDAEDAFQATFLLLARKAHRIRRGALLSAWLHTTAVRVARRARSRRRLMLVAEPPDQPTTDPLPESVEAGTILDAEVRRLPARLRTAFVLCELEGRSHADAASELGCPKGTIDSRMAAAKHRLRAALTRRGLTLAPVAALVGAVPELAYCDAARRAAAFGLERPADESPAVTKLLASAGGSRWLVGVAAALTLAAVGIVATLSGAAGKSDPPPKLPADRPGDGPKPADGGPAGEQRVSMKPLLKRTTIGLPPEDDINADANKFAVEWLSKMYERVVEERRKSERPIIPPAIPNASRGHLLYMNELSVAKVALTDEKSNDPPIKSNVTMWSSEFDKSVEYRNRGYQTLVEQWLGEHGAEASDVLLNRTLKYSFSAEPGLVQSIDEFPVSLPAERAKETANEGVEFQVKKALGQFAEDIRGNVVRVTDRETGKLLIKVGRDSGRARDNTPFGGNVYLGPPLPLTDLTVLVHEKAKEVRLTCVSWDRIKKVVRPPLDQGTLQAANETYVWDTMLAKAPASIVFDPRRRIHAIHLAKAGELILCPTHLGRVVAVDAKTGKVKWTHEYAALVAQRFETFAPEWVVVPPVIVGDKCIYAPADFPELLCLNVTDGKKAWSVKKGDGVYPAVVGDQVLVIGEKTVRSLSLKDGSEQWKVDLPGLPCGRGAVLGNTYLVPVSEPKTWRGMIAVVDLKAGKIAEVLKPEKDEPIGNLVVHQDFLISQTLTEIAVFPIKKKE